MANVKIYPKAQADSIAGLTNFVPMSNGSIRRLGYRNFFGLIWFLIRANHNNRKLRLKSRFDFTLPVPWL